MRYLPVYNSGKIGRCRRKKSTELTRLSSTPRVPWTDREGATRPIASEDVLVVAPYNAQVPPLIEKLPDRARVGTVDKFQGRRLRSLSTRWRRSSVERCTPWHGLPFQLEPAQMFAASEPRA